MYQRSALPPVGAGKLTVDEDRGAGVLGARTELVGRDDPHNRGIDELRLVCIEEMVGPRRKSLRRTRGSQRPGNFFGNAAGVGSFASDC